VRGVSYVLDVTCDPVPEDEAEQVLKSLVVSAAVTYQ
jgi:hypothetical protein